MLYLLIAFILFICSLYNTVTCRNISKLEYIFLFLFFWLIAGSAWETGVDWRQYEVVYNYTYSLSEILKGNNSDTGILAEPGFSLLSSIIKDFTDVYQYLQLIALLIASIFFFKGMKNTTKYYYPLLVIYLGYVYLTLNMSGIRQAIALGIVLYSLNYLKRNEFKKYLICIIGAASFHYSALAFIPLYFFLNKRYSFKLIYALVGIGLLAYLLRIDIFSSLIIRISELFSNPVISKLIFYITETSENSSSISIKFLINVVLLIIISFRYDILVQKNQYTTIAFNLFLLYVLLGEFLWNTGDIIIRMQHYFILGFIIIYPEYVESFKIKSNRVILYSFIFIISIVSSNPIFLNLEGGKAYNPYQNYFIYQILDKKSTSSLRL